MALFQNAVLQKYLQDLNNEKVDAAWELFQSHFHNPEIQENIRNSKEEQYQEGFLRDLFVKMLGYTLNPTSGFNLTTELKNIKDAKKTDGAILKNGKAIAVIELKGTDTTDLSKIEDQAFGYKNNQPDCTYVITSNFEKLRFYIDNAVEHEDFNLFTLTRERFDLLWLCLSADYLLKDLPKKIKDESHAEEEEITKQLYKDYSLFRNEIFENIQQKNPDYDKLTLFKKTQKLLDRFLFIFFAEDRLLLPPNSIREIVKQWTTLKELDAYVPLYNRFKKYFNYMNTGYKGKTYDIFAYNGGLFKADEVLDNIEIDDNLLFEHTRILSNYDFQSEVSVNILGHIFEHSLNEIEEIQAEIEEGKMPDTKVSRRKKDGVFYTPKYITKYIVDHTVKTLCDDKKSELDIQEAEYEKERKGRKKETIHSLIDKLDTYRNWLLDLKICDPACGSGAFLNQALEFLITEHEYIDELQNKLLGNFIPFTNIENSILEKNLYGVDINEESVEIAKLSLWLRTAEKGRKLTSLNDNIKCGNSLIDDPEVAGDKAFNWYESFPQVFEPKEKSAYHITWATHNSRTSQRMIDYNVKKGEAVWLDEEEEVVITETILDIIESDHLNVMAYNICGDHVHTLLVCEEEALPNIIRKLKGKSSQKLKEYHKIPREEKFTLWTQKYSTTYIKSEEELWHAVDYIKTNREKHSLPRNKGLQPLVASEVMNQPIEHAFRSEYKGGFDVVIGNPPYVKLETIKEMSQQVEGAGYATFDKRGDLYVLYVEKGFDILRLQGRISFIMPNKWLQAGYGKPLRQYFLTQRLESLVDFGDIQIFQGATTYPLIFTAHKDKPQETIDVAILDSVSAKDFKTNVAVNKETFSLSEFDEDTWVISSVKDKNLLKRLNEQFKNLNDCVEGKANYGIKTGLTKAFLIDGKTKNSIISRGSNAENHLFPFLQGRDIERYSFPKTDNMLILFEKGFTKFAIGEERNELKAWNWFN
ncbi:Eco57I restriction-modification methylase domain-containing protein [Membranicola marinus]|uniref:site-specific DNA-methyltransferase (adenine-specific) n=1 Tax=Membranihabitans marinus TaxID=1227546 RepID=A0A953LB85_9BACT|nr:N-6 DNA methylase [Membranihabitans marinus]MBY5959488.1 Eco57I restriction-modification methylase domain-containing protein [Membranihabitans marinus]